MLEGQKYAFNGLSQVYWPATEQPLVAGPTNQPMVN